MKYRSIETIEAIGFEEFIQIGLTTEGANIRDDVPWSFDYLDAHVTHEDDDRYLISGKNHFGVLFSIEFERGEFLGTDSDGTMFTASSEWLNDHYEPVETTESTLHHDMTTYQKYPEDEQVQRIEAALNTLREHFDSVLILATKCDGDSTAMFKNQCGNVHAHEGAVREWLREQESYQNAYFGERGRKDAQRHDD
jgi:hypothetical protein